MSLQSIEQFIVNLGKRIAAFLGILKTDAVNVFTVGINILSALISWFQSPEGTLIEDVIVKFIPEIHVAEFVTTFLPKLFIDLKWANSEAGKTTGEIIQDGLMYLASLTATNKVLQFTSAAASIILWLADKLGVQVGTPQQVVTAVPSAYATMKDTLASTGQEEQETPKLAPDGESGKQADIEDNKTS